MQRGLVQQRGWIARQAFLDGVALGQITPGPLALYPFLERWVAGDKREHHVRDRPRNAPARTAVGMAGVTFYGLLRLLGSNDLTASFLNIQLYWTTWFGRVAIFAGPVIAYLVTKLICLGLQRKDGDLLEHGVDTASSATCPAASSPRNPPGIRGRRAVLTSRTGPPAHTGPHPGEDRDGVPPRPPAEPRAGSAHGCATSSTRQSRSPAVTPIPTAKTGTAWSPPGRNSQSRPPPARKTKPAGGDRKMTGSTPADAATPPGAAPGATRL